MADNETKVQYKATANFLALSRALQKAKKDLAELQKQEALLNAQSIAGNNKLATSQKSVTSAIAARNKSLKSATSSLRDYNNALKQNNNLLKTNGSSTAAGPLQSRMLLLISRMPPMHFMIIHLLTTIISSWSTQPLVRFTTG